MPLTRTKVGDLTAHRRSFERSLRAGNKSPRTVETYLDALDQLCAFLAGRGMPTAAEAVTREHIEAYLVELLDLGRAPATVSNRFERCSSSSSSSWTSARSRRHRWRA
jgi:site-specific recombinase XerD